jgi:uncharacterized protein
MPASQPAPTPSNPAVSSSHSVPWTAIAIDDPFWNPRLTTLVEKTLPSQYVQLRSSGRLAALGIWDGPAVAPKPHVFWDSDIAKWIEAVAYAQTWHPDPELRAQAESVIRGYERLQMPDGYLNQSFQSGRIHQRWTNVRDDHELYCAGHLMEAAVAWYEALGDDRFLKIMVRNAEHIWQRFGPDGEAGIPGHEEIELALVRLAGATKEPRWLELARLFVERRGVQPSFWAIEFPRHGKPFHVCPTADCYQQADVPMRQRQGIDGHAVRALYLIAGALDVADRTNDDELRGGCIRSWQRTIERRMYVTGGFGSHHGGERFTADYDLPDREAYAESCASIAACLIARRLLNTTSDAATGDVLERSLYNGVLAGWSQDGEHYFYANPLRSEDGHDGMSKYWHEEPYTYKREQWFGCACCPPNIARCYASLGGFCATWRPDGLDVHLPIGGRLAHQGWDVTIAGDYVGAGITECRIAAQPKDAQVRIRRPSWAGEIQVTVDGTASSAAVINGYVTITTQVGSVVRIDWGIRPLRIHADPRVADAVGKVALQRGPLLYCVEACDHRTELPRLRLADNAALSCEHEPELGATCYAITAEAGSDESDALYATSAPKRVTTTLRAVPYALWANRQPGPMRVWLPRG